MIEKILRRFGFEPVKRFCWGVWRDGKYLNPVPKEGRYVIPVAAIVKMLRATDEIHIWVEKGPQ